MNGHGDCRQDGRKLNGFFTLPFTFGTFYDFLKIGMVE
jgi:hypothetical protein